MLSAHALDYDIKRPCSKRFEYQAAITPLAVFAVGYNSCENDVCRTLIHAEMGRHPKQMSKSFSSMGPSMRPFFLPTSMAAGGGQAFKLKGHIKSKGPSCEQRRMLRESWICQAHRWKGLAASLQGYLS